MATSTASPARVTPPGAEPTLADILHAIEDAHPGWHLWRSEGGKWWASGVTEDGAGGTVEVPSVALADHAIALFKHQRRLALEWERRHPEMCGAA